MRNMLFKYNIFYRLKPQLLHTSACTSYREDYIRLGLSENATKEEIKAAYYEKAKLLHPDAGENCKIDDSEFFELNEAYKRLIYESRYGSGSYDKTGKFSLLQRKGFQFLVSKGTLKIVGGWMDIEYWIIQT